VIPIDTCTYSLSMISQVALVAGGATTYTNLGALPFSIAASADGLHPTIFTVNKSMNSGPMIVS
jgi:hypothetical protein